MYSGYSFKTVLLGGEHDDQSGSGSGGLVETIEVLTHQDFQEKSLMGRKTGCQ